MSVDGHGGHDVSFPNAHPLQIYLFIIGILLILLSFSTLAIITYSLYKQNSNKKKSVRKREANIKKVNYPTIASATFYLISTGLFLYAWYHFDPHDKNNFTDDLDFVYAMLLFVTFIFLAKLSIYTQFLARLYSSFKKSTLAINKSTIIISIILLCLLLFIIVWWIILVSCRHLILETHFNGYDEQFVAIFCCLLIFDVCLSWYIVGLFINKLYQILLLKCRWDELQRAEQTLNLVSTEKIKSDDAFDSKMEEIDKSFSPKNVIKTYSFVLDVVGACIDDNDKKKLDLITRQYILSSLSIFTTQLTYFSLLIIALVYKYDTEHLNYTAIYWIFGGLYYPMDVILNCIALYFNYGFANKYYRFCCKCCHLRCKLFVVRQAAKKIQTKYYQRDLHLKDDADKIIEEDK